MNIVMMTNTFTPHVGGVARSIEQFSAQYREWGHNVLTVAPEFDDMPLNEENVLRIPAVRNFNHTDFSVIKPVPHFIQNKIEAFKPDIIHSHHPFLVGSMALRVARTAYLPLVFTHHTKYEDYTHNISAESEHVKQFAINLASNYANVCDLVFTPSESMRDIIQSRGVTTTTRVVPTGVDIDLFKNPDNQFFRNSLGIPSDAYVVGHLGRITKEKNIEFLAKSVIEFLNCESTPANSCFMICGAGPEMTQIEQLFSESGISDKLFKTGPVDKQSIPNAYAAMDVFTFASQSETQGMVITEAMATGVPVVALEAPGVKDVLNDGVNGRLISTNEPKEFASAISSIASLDNNSYKQMRSSALETANVFSMEKTAHIALSAYKECIEETTNICENEFDQFEKALRLLESEWKIITNTVNAAIESI